MISVLLLAAETATDMAEVLRDTHAFYEAAWSKLTWTLGIELGAVAVLIPLIVGLALFFIERSHREALRVDHEAIRHEIDQGVARARDMSVQQIAPTLSNLAQSVVQTQHDVQQTQRNLLRMTANTLHSFGGMSYQNGKYLAAASFIWTAANHRCLVGVSDQEVARTLGYARRALEQATVEEALDDSEPLEAMQQLGVWFSERAGGPQSKAVLAGLVNQLHEFARKYGEALAKRGGRDVGQTAQGETPGATPGTRTE